MCTQMQPAGRRLTLLSTVENAQNWALVLTASLGLASFGVLNAPQAKANDETASSEESAADEDTDTSVLIASRAAENAQQPATIPDDDDDTLQPISQISEHTPELADLTSLKTEEPAPRPERSKSLPDSSNAKSDDTKQFANALAKVAGDKTDKKSTDAATDTGGLDLGAAYRVGSPPSRPNSMASSPAHRPRKT